MKKTHIIILYFFMIMIVFALVSCGECNHDWNEATCTEPMLCKKCGESNGLPLGHKASIATCTNASVCERCGEIIQEALDHDWKEATCKTAKTCDRCYLTLGYANPTAHSFDSIKYKCCYCNKTAVSVLCDYIKGNGEKLNGNGDYIIMFVQSSSQVMIIRNYGGISNKLGIEYRHNVDEDISGSYFSMYIKIENTVTNSVPELYDYSLYWGTEFRDFNHIDGCFYPSELSSLTAFNVSSYDLDSCPQYAYTSNKYLLAQTACTMAQIVIENLASYLNTHDVGLSIDDLRYH